MTTLNKDKHSDRQTPLYSEHLKLGAQMVPFGGWTMPLHYGSQLKEHEAIRSHVGMFDVSHMAIADIHGTQAKDFLRFVLANDVAKLDNNRALYGCMLNQRGGIIDDLITYKLSDEHYRIIINAATTTKDIRWLEDKTRSFDVSIELMSDFGLIAVQGPKARALVAQCLGVDAQEKISALKPFQCVSSHHLMLARTGYTGEDGLEIAGLADTLIPLWQQLIEKGAQPAGLGARDTLRLEAGLNLYGVDMDETVTPLESNLSWTVDFKDEARNFIGKEALLTQKKEGIANQLTGIFLEGKGLIRGGMKVQCPDGREGVVTSGSYSPLMKASVALVRIPNEPYQTVDVDLRGQLVNAKCVKPPFVRLGKICCL